MNYYSEHDPHAAAWLRNLIAAGEIPKGDIDERDIQDVKATELAGYIQCHFFAGVAGWPRALKLAGWPDDKPVWTASLPCQPFSVAGRRRGHADERHLWPVFSKLLKESRPSICFGEQVSSKDGLAWLDGIQIDLENAGYTVGAFDLCAAGVWAPHIRQRLYWVADAESDGWDERRSEPAGRSVERGRGCHGLPHAAGQRRGEARNAGGGPEERTTGTGSGLAEPTGQGLQRWELFQAPRKTLSVIRGCGGMGDAERLGLSGELRRRPGQELADGRPTLNAWDDYELRTGSDGTTRRIEPGLECLVNGLSFKLADGRSREDASRSKILKGLGNAIVPPLAAEFISAYLDIQKIP